MVRRRVGLAVALICGAPWLGVPAWLVTHPVVHVDNALGFPIDLWVDGARIGTIPAHDGHGEPPRIRVGLGQHKLGWSPRGAPSATHESDSAITVWGDLLYVPDAAACHWLEVVVYGSGSSHGFEHGPLALGEFHQLDGVDVWMEPRPLRVRLPGFLERSVRVRLERWGACMELRGCDLDSRRAYVTCMRSIDGRKGVGDCFGEALRSCSRTDKVGSATIARP